VAQVGLGFPKGHALMAMNFSVSLRIGIVS